MESRPEAILGPVANEGHEQQDTQQQQRAKRKRIAPVGTWLRGADAKPRHQLGEPGLVGAPNTVCCGIGTADREGVFVRGCWPMRDAGSALDAAKGLVTARPFHANHGNQRREQG